MIAPRAREARSLLAGARWGGALVAALAVAALVTIGPPGTARAASGDSYNQMTGVGPTSTAVTVNWTQGLLNAQNQPITTNPPVNTPGHELSPNPDRQAYAANPASATSPLSFMDGDFKNLQVKVSQTENLGHQGVTVTWTGGNPSANSSAQADFLQMMECYGDSSTGPSPEDCEFGSSGMLSLGNGGIGSRTGDICGLGTTPSTDPASTPPGPDGVAWGCDVYEPTNETPAHCDPQQTCQGDTHFSIPFVPVDDPTHPLYANNDAAPLTDAFSQFSTNEVQGATTSSSGTGEQQFETLTSSEAPALGCGELEGNGKPRGCWLVIVPRGEYEPNGFKLAPFTKFPDSFLETSPLSASNWAQRIQVHLGYAPLATNCPLDVQALGIDGTQVITRAVQSWQFALNQAAKCSRIYSFTATEESGSTGDLTDPAPSGIGLAFTSIPIGSEAARDGQPPPTLPKILYAPVAVTALGFGFNINERPVGYVTKQVNLTPRLVAKALTQSYREDLPDYDPNLLLPGPAWSQHNPENITQDPAFQKLNPVTLIPTFHATRPLAPLLIGDLSADNQRVWQWIQSDSKTSSWLDGTPDPADPVTADPEYVKAKLGKPPAVDSYPQDFTGVLDLGVCDPSTGNPNCSEKKEMKLGTQDMLPVATDLDSAAAAVLAAANGTQYSRTWDATAKAPDGSSGWWDLAGAEPSGQVFMWTANDLPDLAAYGLISAQLCNPAGGNCVGPSTGSVAKALNSATKDSAGLLQVNPAKVPAGGYPLVDVIYAAVPTNQPAAALNDYADLIHYAAGQGQATGSAPGDLPPGYLPLPAGLQKQAQAVVGQLHDIANRPHTPGSPTPAPSGTQSTSSTSTGANPAAGSAAGTSTGLSGGTSTGAQGGANSGAATSGSPSPQGPVIVPPSAELAGGTTPRSDVGTIRWVLITIVIIGGAGVLGGTLLRSGKLPRLRRGART